MDSATQWPLFRIAAQSVRKNWAFFLLVSLAILIPCFWHKHIEAGDLGSHIYNAWLAELVEGGKTPGLWIASQWNNIAFDLLIGGFAKTVGWVWSERLAVSICVLIFFWGLFALVGAAARRAPFFLVPLIAMVTYGWTFEQGFINYYLALGFSFFALAILWRGTGKERIASLALVPLIFLAHPLGLVWFAGVAAYLVLSERFRQYRGLLFAGAALLNVCITVYLRGRLVTYNSYTPRYLFNGADQIVLYSKAYEVIAIALTIFVLFALSKDLRSQWNDTEFRQTGGTVLQLYLILQFLVFFLPFGVLLPGYKAPITYFPHRLTTLSAVLICMLIGLVRPRKWHLWGYALAAIMFFSFLYRDTGIVNEMEAQCDKLVAKLPYGRRVLFTVTDRGLRLNIGHFVDRSCIGHCFSYGNYEPSTDQFRVRALPGNGVVMTRVPDVWQMEDGVYEVTSSDLPVDEIYQCGEHGRQLCIQSLAAGEKNNPSPKSGGSPFELDWSISARVSSLVRETRQTSKIPSK